MSEQTPVLFELKPCGNGKHIAIATLNVEKSLNALNLEMIDLLQAQLADYEQDDSVVCVFLQGSGDKAFCAGGDVVALYEASAAYGEDAATGPAIDFFSREYRLDYQIHTYSKPIIVWGNGFVMGGGLGLMSGASHRVATERTRMAMPEVTIGLYPDVGATWFLNRTPGHSGLFLGLTGAQMNAADAIFVGLADRFISHGQKEAVIAGLTGSEWSEQAEQNYQTVSQVLRGFEQLETERPEGQVEKHLPWINSACDADTTAEIVAQILAHTGEDAWLNKAVAGLKNGCPMTPHLLVEQLKRGRHLSLADAFRMELILSVNSTQKGHFREGVRALLIDKDRQPKWTPDHVNDVDISQVSTFFNEPWTGEHPLADLQ